MDIRTIPIELINPAAYNPRIDLQPGDPAYEKLKRSIEEFGYVDPIIWNERTGNMVVGHQRYKILVNEQCRTEIEVSVIDMDPEQSLIDRFGIPPLSVFDARQGYWQDRKRAWLSLGINSEVGAEAHYFII